MTMDVAPFIKDSRTFLPLRYVANAVGVTDSNIIYDPSTQKVTITKGGMVIQLTIGSTGMLMNGPSIAMDTAPIITDGRTCLPVAWVAQALGASVKWDATAQTATVTLRSMLRPLQRIAETTASSDLSVRALLLWPGSSSSVVGAGFYSLKYSKLPSG